MNSYVDLALQIDRLMRRINADLHPQAKHFDYENVGPIGGMLLLTIGEAEPVSLQAVIAKMGRDKSQITRLLQKLVQKGLVAKERDDDDGRELILCLTPKGQQQLNSIQKALADVVKHIFEPIKQEDVKAFSEILERLLQSDAC